MYKTTAWLAIALMMLNTVVFAQTGTTERKQRPQQRVVEQPTRPLVDTSLINAQSGQQLVHGLDRAIDPDTYVIGPSDEFVLVIRSAEETEIKLRVLPEGTVLLPNIGALKVAGQTITEFRQMLRERLGPYYHNVQFDCELVIPRTLVVYVLGEVTKPGPVELNAPFRLDTALDGAGGITDKGSHRAIQIREHGDVVRTVDLQRFELLGAQSEDPCLKEGQTVLVPPQGPSCSVAGEVWRNGTYEIVDGETVGDLVELAGGLHTRADRDRIVLERVNEGDSVTVREMPWDQARAVTVRDRDTIVIPDRQSFPQMPFVRVIGGGGREGTIYITPGETLASFMPRFVRLQDDQQISRAVIERRLASGERTYIPVDLEAVIAGDAKEGAIELKPGDIISIPPMDKVVFVVGEVMAPGPIPFQRGLPAERYIALAGGPKDSGSLDRLEIISPNGQKRRADRTSTVYRGETVLVKRKVSKIVGTAFVTLTSATSLLLSIIAVSRH